MRYPDVFLTKWILFTKQKEITRHNELVKPAGHEREALTKKRKYRQNTKTQNESTILTLGKRKTETDN